MTTKHKKAPAGPAGDVYVVEARGRRFFVISVKTGATVGVYNDRESAQRRADDLQSAMWSRFGR
jgi:hypothetical protein